MGGRQQPSSLSPYEAHRTAWNVPGKPVSPAHANHPHVIPGLIPKMAGTGPSEASRRLTETRLEEMDFSAGRNITGRVGLSDSGSPKNSAPGSTASKSMSGWFSTPSVLDIITTAGRKPRTAGLSQYRMHSIKLLVRI